LKCHESSKSENTFDFLNKQTNQFTSKTIKTDYNHKFNEFFKSHNKQKVQRNNKINLNISNLYSFKPENRPIVNQICYNNNQNKSISQENDEYSHLIPENSFLNVDENIFKDYKSLHKILRSKERKQSNLKIKMTPFQKFVELKKSFKHKIYEKGKENNLSNNKSIGEINVKKIVDKKFMLNLKPLNNQKYAFKERSSILRKFEHIHLKQTLDRFTHRHRIEQQISPLISEHIIPNDRENNVYEKNSPPKETIIYGNLLSDQERNLEKYSTNNINNIRKDYTSYYKSFRDSVFYKSFEAEEEEYECLKVNETIKNNQETQTNLNTSANKTTIFLNNNLTEIKEKVTNEINLCENESFIKHQKNEHHNNIKKFILIKDRNVISSYNNIDKEKKNCFEIVDSNSFLKNNEVEKSKSRITYKDNNEARYSLIKTGSKLTKRLNNLNNGNSSYDNHFFSKINNLPDTQSNFCISNVSHLKNRSFLKISPSKLKLKLVVGALIDKNKINNADQFKD